MQLSHLYVNLYLGEVQRLWWQLQNNRNGIVNQQHLISMNYATASFHFKPLESTIEFCKAKKASAPATKASAAPRQNRV